MISKYDNSKIISSIKRLFSYAFKYKFMLILALFLLFITTLVQVIIPQVAKFFIDNYIDNDFLNNKMIIYILVLYYLLFIFQALFNYLSKYIFAKVSCSVVRDLRVDAFSNMQKLSMRYFDKTSSGSILSKITNDTENINNMFGVVFSGFIRGVFLIVVSIYSLFLLDYKLGFYVMLLFIIIIPSIYYCVELSNPYLQKLRQKMSDINSKLAESIEGIAIIQVFGQEKRFRKEFSKITNEYYDLYVSYLKIDSLLLRPAISLFKMLAYAIILFYFGYNGVVLGFTAGIMYAFVQYINRLFDPLIEFTQSFSILQRSLVSAERIFDIIDEKDYEPKQNDKDYKIVDGNIVFKNVSFSYDDKKDVLKNINIEVKKGETLAFVGHTGSGKSSIINLIMRFYEFNKGEILIDGKSIKDYSRQELFSNMGLVLQDSFLYYGNVLENIRLHNNNLTESDVKEAAKFVYADSFIEEFDDKYYQKVVERGSTFSSGQKQLISFARTIAQNPKILILDEATANIDSKTEELIQKSLKNMRKGRTTIIVAHRLSTIQDANCICVLDKGKIVERGTHEELLNIKGIYYKMYRLQKGN